MNTWLETDTVLIMLTALALVGSSRVDSCIRLAAIQGFLVGFTPLVVGTGGSSGHAILVAAGTVVLKGLAFPWLLARARRDASVSLELNPFLGYSSSVMIGVAALAGAFWLAERLPASTRSSSTLVLPTAFFLVFMGLFVIVSRRLALVQVIGYLVLENGIQLVGVTFASHQSALVEIGLLLDVFGVVFIMGIAVFRISRTFEHVEADRLTVLRDWRSRRSRG